MLNGTCANGFITLPMDNLEGMLTAVVKAGSEAVIVAGSSVFFLLQPRIAQWAEVARTPVISPWRELPEAGGPSRSQISNKNYARAAGELRIGTGVSKLTGQNFW